MLVSTVVGQTRTSMDELMLAMDIVDTLRHEQSLVERELASTDRDDAFVARVKQIYASQGIEVTDTLIRQGVESLKQDRFVYQPPKRTFSVRLAEVWIDRWRWSKRALITGLIVFAGWLVVAVPNRFMAERAYRAYVTSVSELQQTGDTLARRRDALTPRLTAIAADPPALVAAPLQVAHTRIEAEHSALIKTWPGAATTMALDADHFAKDPDAATNALATPRQQLTDAVDQIERVEAQLTRAEALRTAALTLTQLDAQFAGLTLAEPAQAQVASQRAQAEASLRAGEISTAKLALQAMERTAATVNLAYTLRIVNREGVKSGVWRHHADAPDGKNYYVVVEAIDAAGNALMLPVLNEETQRTQAVSLFALRVPQSEYERVKADKLDNGLIDDALVGEKRRGELDAEYHIAVAGGTITDW